MRRSDREVKDLDDIISIISQCDVCRLALNGQDGYPYILPLNFGYYLEDDRLHLCFHSASEGHKHALIALDPRATFEMDCNHTLLSVVERGYCTMNYESVIGQGTISYVTDPDERLRLLTILTDRYHSAHFAFDPAAASRTSVYVLTVTALTAKRKSSSPH